MITYEKFFVLFKLDNVNLSYSGDDFKTIKINFWFDFDWNIEVISLIPDASKYIRINLYILLFRQIL